MCDLGILQRFNTPQLGSTVMEAFSGHGSAEQEIAGGNTRHACGAQPGDQITARLLGIVVENITPGRVDENPRCRAKGRSIHPGAFEERAGR